MLEINTASTDINSIAVLMTSENVEVDWGRVIITGTRFQENDSKTLALE